MTMGDRKNFPENHAPSMPKVTLPTMFRLGLFNMGLGLMAVLTLAVLNRVMINELAIPASVTAGILAMSQIIAPAKVWIGQLSDSKPLFKLHRSGYVRLGAAFFGIAILIAVQIVWQLGSLVNNANGWFWGFPTISLTIILGLFFLLYGLALSTSSTPFTALLVDISDEDNRSKIVSITWSMLMVGIILGGITGKVLLDNLEPINNNINASLSAAAAINKIPIEILQQSINTLFLMVPLIVFGLVIIATWRVEKKYSRYGTRSVLANSESNITVRQAFKVLTASRQTGIFFLFVTVVNLSLFMQEAVLEPYGAKVFGMSIGDTTLLNSYWGIGILLGYGITGFKIIPTIGKKATARLGCLLVAICFILIILAGFTEQQTVLKLALILFGFATGVTTISSISLMLDLTAAETAGTFIGTWGLAQALSRALATFSGGLVLDVGKLWFDLPVLAYGLVFGMQAIGMMIAIAILKYVDVAEFKNNTREAIAQVMEGDLDG
ncbi:MAG: BCD family MFS transporter [Calothrix sp. MO_167.B12]|nr:BCD family MFS transporter [Calothrix sp. MO_167.B12]